MGLAKGLILVTFDLLKIGTSFLVLTYIFIISGSSLSIKVIESWSGSHEQNFIIHILVLLIVPEIWRSITVSSWLSFVAPSNHWFIWWWHKILKFEVYYKLLYPLWVVNSLRTLKTHHCLSLLTTGYTVF